MIVVDVSAQDSPEVSLVEDDHVIETLAPNASNDPFDVGALPRGARRRRNLLDVESRNAPFEVRPVDSIPVSQQVTRRRIPRKSINDLLRGPLCRRMLRDIEMDDAPAIVTENDENEQNPEGGGRQREEVDGHQDLDMIVEKAPPGLGRWLATANHVLGNSGLRNGDAELG